MIIRSPLRLQVNPMESPGAIIRVTTSRFCDAVIGAFAITSLGSIQADQHG